jgi:ADP-L-glycero-D-manno-heptose 6-epimerase
MMIVTGAQGFIGSVMVHYLNTLGITDIALIDDVEIDRNLGYAQRVNYTYLQNKKFTSIDPILFDKDCILPQGNVTGVFHFGAISNTLEKDEDRIRNYNLLYTDILASACRERKIPLIFASSAAVYGNGSGPLNLYAKSKLQSEEDIKDAAVCLRLFNVYGPNEYHKGRMSSVILKWIREIDAEGKARVFENSHLYRRDFIHVLDVCKVAFRAFLNFVPGVYDLGTGVSTDFDYLATLVLSECRKNATKEYIPMPDDLKIQYQTDTKASIDGLMRNNWTDGKFIRIEQGVNKYWMFAKDERIL